MPGPVALGHGKSCCTRRKEGEKQRNGVLGGPHPNDFYRRWLRSRGGEKEWWVVLPVRRLGDPSVISHPPQKNGVCAPRGVGTSTFWPSSQSRPDTAGSQ